MLFKWVNLKNKHDIILNAVFLISFAFLKET